ncbi:MAG: phospholipase D-like domain-containing protein [Armatimonadota bacterium]
MNNISAGIPKIKLPDARGAKSAASVPGVFIMDGSLDYILNWIKSAKTRIYIKVYIFTDVDGRITDELIKARDRGVDVKVMIEPDPFYWTEDHFNPSYAVRRKLRDAGINYRTTNPYFGRNKTTHEKSLLVDNAGIILTGNLSKSSFTGKNLDMGVVVVNNPAITGQMAASFMTDWDRKLATQFYVDTGLTMSPFTSITDEQSFYARDRIVGLIGSAKKSVHILIQGFEDEYVIEALIKKKKEGVDVFVILADPHKAQGNQATVMVLKNNGIKVKALKTPWLHAKAVAVDAEDYDPDNNLSFVGSQNFTTHGLTMNREMGLVFFDPDGAVEKVFDEYEVYSQTAGRTYLMDDEGVKKSLAQLINHSATSVTISSSALEDGKILESLVNAKKRGVDVKIILPPDSAAYYDGPPELTESVVCSPGSDADNTMAVFDGKISVILPCGLDKEIKGSFEAVVSCDEGAVAELDQKLDKDFIYEYLAQAKDALFTGQNAEYKKDLLKLINEAGASVYVEAVYLNDKDILKALTAKAKEGIAVKVILKDVKENLKTADFLKHAGIYVELISGLDTRNNILITDSESVYISVVPFDELAKSTSFGMENREIQIIEKSNRNFGLKWKIASVDHAKKQIDFKVYELTGDEDFPMLEVLINKAKEGVLVNIETKEILPELEHKIKSQKIKTLKLIKSDKIEEGTYNFKVDGELSDFSKNITGQK